MACVMLRKRTQEYSQLQILKSSNNPYECKKCNQWTCNWQHIAQSC